MDAAELGDILEVHLSSAHEEGFWASSQLIEKRFMRTGRKLSIGFE
jgi:hypothetical protein